MFPRWTSVGSESDLSLMMTSNGLTKRAGRNVAPSAAVVSRLQREEFMDRSVGQARWLLAPIFAVAITVMVIGLALG